MATMEKNKVAVIGAGPSGLSMLKQLREDGFAVTVLERREQVGGLWAYSRNEDYTVALPRTIANISKFTCGFSDYPIPDKYPTFMNQQQFQEFLQGYATHFDLLKDIVFGVTVTLVRRNARDTGWLLDVERPGGHTETLAFDKVVFCHGYQTQANIPVFGGEDSFAGTILHAQQYRSPEPFRGKNVVVVGLTSSAGDIVPDIVPVAGKVYLSHRRGAVPFMRYKNGTPVDLMITWRRRRISHFFQRWAPRLHRAVVDLAVGWAGRRTFPEPLDPAWRIAPFPSVTTTLPGSWEFVYPHLVSGAVQTVHGLRRYGGPRSVELADGTVLDDIDAVLYCTGYRADWSLAPFVETSRPATTTTPRDPSSHPGADGLPPLYRLYQNLFPPAYADSCVLLCYSAFGKSNGFSFADVLAMAVSNVWRGVAPDVPSRAAMEQHVDAHQAWVAARWRRDPTVDTSCVQQHAWQEWLHRAAGTGMEHLGWGWKGWAFWLRDRRLYKLMNDGVETAHMYRYFETGKRKTWPGARDEIIRINERVRATFPTQDTKLE